MRGRRAAPSRAGAQGCGAARADPRVPSRVARHVWGAADSPGSARRRRARRPQARGAVAQAGRPAGRESPQVAGDDRARPHGPAGARIWCSGSSRRPARISSGWPTSPTSRRGRHAVSGGRPRRLESPHHRLGDGDAPAHEPRPGRARHGDRRSAGRRRSSIIRTRAVSTRPIDFGRRCRDGGRPAVDGLGRRLLRQRHVRELLRDARVRAARSRDAAHAGEARRAVFDFIEGWYNPRRRHSALDYESPIGLRAAARPSPPRAERHGGRAREATGLWKLPDLWTHRTRPQVLGKPSAFSTAPTGPHPRHD